MKDILYLMHVHWGWIKQRPHFIAELLANSYTVDVAFRKSYNLRQLVNNTKTERMGFLEIPKIPLINNIPFLKDFGINEFLIKQKILRVLYDYRIVWVTHPMMYDYIMDAIHSESIIIYDCMDDCLEFPDVVSNKSIYDKLYRIERRLVNDSRIIFCSSEYLKNKLITRYGFRINIHVINNAIQIEQAEMVLVDLPENITKLFSGNYINIVYLGTISEWIDFPMIIESLGLHPEIRYIFIGPKDVNIPQFERIVYCGPVEHKYVFSIMQQADLLIMPFTVTELIKSVDPVKLYEYIFSGKPIAAPLYGETIKFKKYVYLYNNNKEFNKIVDNIKSSKKQQKIDEQSCYKYVMNNTWNNRVRQVVRIMEDLIDL